VWVEVAQVPAGLRLTVQDDGPGIPADQLEHVFDRYYRLADQSVHGTGLGLAICRTVADIHQATISLAAGPDGRVFGENKVVKLILDFMRLSDALYSPN
jgi:signal transduction histidine kinase